MTRWISAAIAAVALGCGGPAEVLKGTVQGHAMTPKEAIYAIVTGAGGTGQSLSILLSDTPGVCARVTAGNEAKGSSELTFYAQVLGSNHDGAALQTGAYDITTSVNATGSVAFAYFNVFDAHCQSVLVGNQSALADSGSVTVSSFSTDSSGTSAGTFAIGFGSDNISGGFSATNCPAFATAGITGCE